MNYIIDDCKGKKEKRERESTRLEKQLRVPRLYQLLHIVIIVNNNLLNLKDIIYKIFSKSYNYLFQREREREREKITINKNYSRNSKGCLDCWRTKYVHRFRRLKAALINMGIITCYKTIDSRQRRHRRINSRREDRASLYHGVLDIPFPPRCTVPR